MKGYIEDRLYLAKSKIVSSSGEPGAVIRWIMKSSEQDLKQNINVLKHVDKHLDFFLAIARHFNNRYDLPKLCQSYISSINKPYYYRISAASSSDDQAEKPLRALFHVLDKLRLLHRLEIISITNANRLLCTLIGRFNEADDSHLSDIDTQSFFAGMLLIIDLTVSNTISALHQGLLYTLLMRICRIHSIPSTNSVLLVYHVACDRLIFDEGISSHQTPQDIGDFIRQLYSEHQKYPQSRVVQNIIDSGMLNNCIQSYIQKMDHSTWDHHLSIKLSVINLQKAFPHAKICPHSLISLSQLTSAHCDALHERSFGKILQIMIYDPSGISAPVMSRALSSFFSESLTPDRAQFILRAIQSAVCRYPLILEKKSCSFINKIRRCYLAKRIDFSIDDIKILLSIYRNAVAFTQTHKHDHIRVDELWEEIIQPLNTSFSSMSQKIDLWTSILDLSHFQARACREHHPFYGILQQNWMDLVKKVMSLMSDCEKNKLITTDDAHQAYARCIVMLRNDCIDKNFISTIVAYLDHCPFPKRPTREQIWLYTHPALEGWVEKDIDQKSLIEQCFIFVRLQRPCALSRLSMLASTLGQVPQELIIELLYSISHSSDSLKKMESFVSIITKFLTYLNEAVTDTIRLVYVIPGLMGWPQQINSPYKRSHKHIRAMYERMVRSITWSSKHMHDQLKMMCNSCVGSEINGLYPLCQELISQINPSYLIQKFYTDYLSVCHKLVAKLSSEQAHDIRRVWHEPQYMFHEPLLLIQYHYTAALMDYHHKLYLPMHIEQLTSLLKDASLSNSTRSFLNKTILLCDYLDLCGLTPEQMRDIYAFKPPAFGVKEGSGESEHYRSLCDRYGKDNVIRHSWQLCSHVDFYVPCAQRIIQIDSASHSAHNDQIIDSLILKYLDIRVERFLQRGSHSSSLFGKRLRPPSPKEDKTTLTRLRWPNS